MALPTLDATFASAADLPRRQMLAKWLVEELGSGSIADYYDLPERYLWAKIAVAAGGPKTEADYISLPKNYAWSDIYNAVSGDIAQSTVVVSGLSDSQFNGNYVYDGDLGGKPSYRLNANVSIYWDVSQWALFDVDSGNFATSESDVIYPWQTINWANIGGIDPAGLIITPQTPNHTDWSENVALGHIAAAYRGDTGNPANLATYIDWPWRYKVASIISHLVTPASYNAVIVSGAGTTSINETYEFFEVGGEGKNSYQDNQGNSIFWSSSAWNIYSSELGDDAYRSSSDTEFPWEATGWTAINGSNPVPTLTPTNV